jgi:hypothetical protein
MRTELVHEVSVARYAVFAEMAWLERRPELGFICRLARDSGRRITLSVVQQALPGLADVGSENVVRRCQELHLCDPSGSLTGLGEDVADTDKAPVPEQGVYDVWAVHHALLGSRMLHVERLNSSRDGRFDDIKSISVDFEQGRIFASVVDRQSRFVLRSFPSSHGALGAIHLPTRARCQVRWVLDWTREANEVRLDGVIDAGSREHPISHEPEQVEIDLWRLMQNWALGPLRDHGDWSDHNRRLAIAFTELSVEEQESFTKELDLGEVEIPRYGRWSGVRLSDVPIGPATAGDAGQWAMGRLDRRLEGSEVHRTRAEIRWLFADVTEGTPLAPWDPTLPDHDTVLARYKDNPGLFWRLAAPVDLAPLATPQEELGPMKIGEDASGVASWSDDGSDERVAVVRMPYRSGWSMQTLLDRLTHHRELCRLLLVDRYVRGDDNLARLELLVRTLAGHGSPILDVWTGNEVNDETITEIQRITGRRPQRYRDVFRRSGYPHDRYLVVVPEHGNPFSWTMTNSILDARADNGATPSPVTPLRWRDLTATRLAVAQLHEEMAVWANRDIR